jgi:hypothetical protein
VKTYQFLLEGRLKENWHGFLSGVNLRRNVWRLAMTTDINIHRKAVIEQHDPLPRWVRELQAILREEKERRAVEERKGSQKGREQAQRVKGFQRSD